MVKNSRLAAAVPAAIAMVAHAVLVAPSEISVVCGIVSAVLGANFYAFYRLLKFFFRYNKWPKIPKKHARFNPATGLPMMSGNVDIAGNYYGRRNQT